LTWNSASGATSYYIYRSTSYYGDYSYIVPKLISDISMPRCPPIRPIIISAGG
jgi:hypothetical protein